MMGCQDPRVSQVSLPIRSGGAGAEHLIGLVRGPGLRSCKQEAHHLLPLLLQDRGHSMAIHILYPQSPGTGLPWSFVSRPLLFLLRARELAEQLPGSPAQEEAFANL